MKVLEILSGATFDDFKVGLTVVAVFMTMQITASIARYCFNVTINPFDILARMLSPSRCKECGNHFEKCKCFAHLKGYSGFKEYKDD